MPSHNQPTSITASATNVMSDVKRRAKPGKLPRQNFTVGQALLQAFQSSLRKKDTSSIAGKAAASAGSGVNIDEKTNVDKRLERNFESNKGKKLQEGLEITSILSDIAGFPINGTCLSALAGIEPTVIVELLHAASFRKLRARRVVYREGDKVDNVTYLLEGSLTVFRYSPDGRELVLDYLGRGDFIGEVPMSTGNNGYKADFKTREDCKVAEIPIDEFQKICLRHPEFLLQMTKNLAQRLLYTEDRIYDLVFLDVTSRVANALQYLADSPTAITHPQGMQIRITRQEIVSLVGCSREMVGRALKELTSTNKISVDGKNIVIFG